MASIARQAIVDEKRDVYGYELFDRSVAHNAHTAASDAALLELSQVRGLVVRFRCERRELVFEKNQTQRVLQRLADRKSVV